MSAITADVGYYLLSPMSAVVVVVVDVGCCRADQSSPMSAIIAVAIIADANDASDASAPRALLT
jgi:hypothetical protein